MGPGRGRKGSHCGPGGAQLVLFSPPSEVGMTGPHCPRAMVLGCHQPSQWSHFKAIACPHPPPLTCPTPSQPALSPGTVAVTHVLAYLEAVTGRGPQDARLRTLACSLDPNGEGPQATVDLDTFLVIMRDWIAACQRDGWVPAPPPSPRKPFLRSNLIPAYCSQHPLGTATCCSWKEAEEERKVEMGLGGGSEDKVPEIGRQRESGGRNKMGWKEEKGDC